MILQSLHSLHSALEKDDSYDLAPEGYSIVSISFVIELELDGTYEIKDCRKDGRGIPMTLPGPKAHSNKVEAFPFRDTATYLLGHHQGEGKPENTRKRFLASKFYHQELAEKIPSAETEAVSRFFDQINEHGLTLPSDFDSKIFLNSGVFKLNSPNAYSYVHESPQVKTWWDSLTKKDVEDTDAKKQPEGFCLVTGQYLPLATTHTPAIGGNMPSPAQSKAPIVAFNKGKPAFESYGNHDAQALNAPVSQDAATKYCKVLNTLLSDSRHHFRMGETTVAFWTESPIAEYQEDISSYFSGKNIVKTESNNAMDSTLLDALEGSIISIRQGVPPSSELPKSQVPFHLLGLTGQAGGRIGIRFHLTSTLGNIVTNLARHHADLALSQPTKNKEGDKVGFKYPSIRSLFELTGREAKNQPSTLIQNLIAAIINGAPYPTALLQMILTRIRSDRHIDPTIFKDKALETYQAREQAYLRVAMLKAILTRDPNHKSTITHMLDTSENTEHAYKLGRLFAVLEKIQEDALGSLNSGLRDKYYSSASATPANVFPILLRNCQNHLTKIPSGKLAEKIGKEKATKAKRGREILLQEILDGVESSGFQTQLTIKSQGIFAIAYYHQRKAFFEKQEKPETPPTD